MARRIARMGSRASAAAALLALAIVLLAGATDALELTQRNLLTSQETALAVDTRHCPAGAMDCEPDTGGASLPCSGMDGHCSQAGMSLMPPAFVAPMPLAGKTTPRGDVPGAGVHAAIDTPPPRP